MKLKKWTRVACLGLLMAMLLSGCASEIPIPEDMDEQALLAAGQEVFDLLIADEFETICDRIRDDIVTQVEITPEKIQKQMDVDEQQYGKLKKVKETWTSGVPADEEAKIEEHVIAWFECEYAEQRLVYGFSFDLDLNLIGMSVNRE
ncbi:MAG: hypothetical protein J6Q14_02630 [Oscillospiraceae bacterium]|nr:hypothetical protein [Oscillospiraceae bacterium]